MTKTPLLAGVVLFMLPATSNAQLGLGQSGRSTDEYDRRAQQFRTNRGLADMYMKRLRGQSLVYGRSNTQMRGLQARPMIMNPEYGLLRNFQGPMDRPGRLLRAYRLFDIDSEIARTAVDLPQVSDNVSIEEFAWTKDEVLAAMRNNRSPSTLSLIDRDQSHDVSGELDPQLQSAADAYFERCSASFRASLDAKEPRERSSLIAVARNSTELMNQIEIDQPRGYLAAALIAFHTREFNTAMFSLEMGLKRGDSLAALRIDRKSFFGESTEWRRTLDQINEAATVVNANPRLYLLQSYYAFLDDDLRRAHSAAEKAVSGLKARTEKGSDDVESAADEISGPSKDTTIDTATRFMTLLAEEIKATSESGRS